MKTRYLLFSVIVAGLIVVGPTAQQPRLEARQPREIKDLTQALTHASSPEADECIRGLQAISRFAPAKRDRLIVLLFWRCSERPEPEVRAAAARAAADMAKLAPEYRDACSHARLLTDSDKKVRSVTLESLHDLGGPASSEEVLALVRLLKDENPDVRHLVYANLRRAGEKACLRRSSDIAVAAVPALLERLDIESADEDPKSKYVSPLRHAVQALGAIGRQAPKAVPALLKVYDRFPAAVKRDAEMREVVVEALAEIGPFSEKSRLFLTKLLRDENLPIQERVGAVWALGRFGPQTADLVPEMLTLLQLELKQPNPPPGTGDKIIDALVWLNEAAEPAIPFLLELAQGDEKASVTGYAIRALGSLAPITRTRAAPIFAKVYFSRAIHPQDVELLKALTRFGDMTTPLAVEALKVPGYKQEKAISLLGTLGLDAKPAIPELKRVAEDKSHPHQTSAKQLLDWLQR